MHYVWETSPTTGSQRLMLLAIADAANDDGVCFPGVGTLAKKLNTTERNAQKLIRSLAKAGEITIHTGKGIKTAHGWTNRYNMTFNGVSISTPRAMSVSKVTPQEVNASTPQEVSKVTPYPIVEPSVEPKEGEAAPEIPKADEVQPELELPSLGAMPAHMLNFEAHHGMSNPYIEAFTEVYGDTTLIKDRRARITADALQQAGATPDDVRRIATAKAAAGKKDYRFAYVVQDFAGEKAVTKAKTSPPAIVINPDDVIRMDANTYVPSIYRKTAVPAVLSDDKAVDDVA